MSDDRGFPDHDYQPPTYSVEEIQALRIRRVHFLEDFLVCLLSDGRALCIPLSLSPALQAASPEQRYQWQLVGDGRGVVWYAGGLEEHLNLRSLLAHPEARIGDIGGPW
jgi:hypothetical protein